MFFCPTITFPISSCRMSMNALSRWIFSFIAFMSYAMELPPVAEVISGFTKLDDLKFTKV